MRIIFSFLVFEVFLCCFELSGQDDEAGFIRAMNNITQGSLQAQLGFVASDWTEGRETGKRGEYLAADYIASLFRLYGVKPGGDLQGAKGLSNLQGNKERTYFQNLTLIKTSPGEEPVLKVISADGTTIKTVGFANNIDFSMISQGLDVEIDAPVVFAGYGFKNEKLRHNDFSKLDLKGKFILKISGIPDFAKKQLSASEISAASWEAENYARKMGAAGIIEFSPGVTIAGDLPVSDFLNMSPSENRRVSARQWVDYSLPDKKSPDNFLHILVSLKTANEILDGTEFHINYYIKKSGSGTSIPLPALKGKRIYFKTTVKEEAVRVRNVIGMIEGNDPNQVIVLGAHYDHLGTANGYIWNGADDNGSGTVGVMTLARAFMETGIKPERTLVFALWTAEEEGLLGSKYYVSNLPFPMKNLRLNVNFDMISRYMSENEPKKVAMIYTENFPIFRTITEENIKKYGIDLDVDFQPSDDPPGGSDHRTFAEAGIPVLRFKPGHREQYHTPADEVSTIDWDIMEKIIKISFADVWSLANSNW
jgi:hypothetical protein